jgi:cellulose synthase/poly-beta-1,6-N-acetylglucosamine synthase-like glycosyltransferase
MVWLTTAFGVMAVAAASALLIPSAVVFVQVLFSRRAGGTNGPDSPEPLSAGRPSVVVLIPAHNEEQGIQATLKSVLLQLNPGDRALVVADNCVDNTAHLARAAGAEVIERQHASLRGKGYALDFGIRHLEANPPAVVIIVDADCLIEPGSIDALAVTTHQLERPTQALYLMHATADPTAKQRLSAFAWLLRNQVRPTGALAMGWPCQLMGSGMGFVYEQLRHAPLATGNIVEDMQLGMDLASQGRPPIFVPTAVVHSVFPSGEQAGRQQRTRWEHGHISTISNAWRQWGVQALRGRTNALMPMLLDLSVPPLTLMVMLQLGSMAAALVLALLGLGTGPLWFAVALLALGLLLTAAAVFRAWSGFGRHLMSASELLTMPTYALRKIPLYLGFLSKRQTAWVRTERDVESRKTS